MRQVCCCHSFDPTQADPAKRKNRQVVATCDYTTAVLLTQDCEIDKSSTQDLTLAIVRPFDSTVLQDAARAQGIRENKKFAMFYLMPQDKWAECYVDFRRLVSVSPAVLKSFSPPVRRLSLAARDAMLFQFFTFLTRRVANESNTTAVEE